MFHFTCYWQDFHRFLDLFDQAEPFMIKAPFTIHNFNSVTFKHKVKHICHPRVNMWFLRKSPPHTIFWVFQINMVVLWVEELSVCGERKWKKSWMNSGGGGSCHEWNETTLSRVEKKGLHSFTPTNGTTARDFPKHLRWVFTSFGTSTKS